MGLLIWQQWRTLPRLEQSQEVRVPPSTAWPTPASLPSDWTVFLARTPQPTPAEGSLSRVFRLVGTYFESSPAGPDVRRAVLDDFEHGVQRIVSENDTLGEVAVVRIFRDRVILRKGDHEEELWLAFTARAGTGCSTGEEPAATLEEEIPTDRFGGRRVAENQWIFKREALLNYYKELMDQPRRLLAVFDSMKPVYDEDRKITGYQLEAVGEKEFYAAVGLQNGDLVRKVNSLPMTNRRRAEYFISEFVNDRANAFVLEIERNGQPLKLVYQVR
ncbi:MAG: hypothetical protein ACUVWX_10935 [Kiritimatiellia bacterium]